jgi:hypothetical protein
MSTIRVTIDNCTHRIKNEPIDIAWHMVAPSDIPDYQCPLFVEVSENAFNVLGSISNKVIGKIYIPKRPSS